VREDLTKHLAGLPCEDTWRPVAGGSLGFHIRHLGGSVERLTTYLMGGQLTEAQLASLRCESEPGEDLSQVLEKMNTQLARAEQRLRTIDPATIYDSRTVGRRALPTTVIGLLVHICEHTQRHLGQAIEIAKMLRGKP